MIGFTPETNLEKAGKGGLVLGPNLKLGGLMEKPGVQDKAHVSPSIKGKKVMARNRVLTQLNKKASNNNMSHFTSATQPFSFLDNNGVDANFHFSSAPNVELGKQGQGRDCGALRGGDSRNQSVVIACDGAVRLKSEGRSEKEAGSEVGVGLTFSVCPNLEKNAKTEVGDEYGGDRASPNTESREKRDGGNDGEDRMEFEEGGGSAISL